MSRPLVALLLALLVLAACARSPEFGVHELYRIDSGAAEPPPAATMGATGYAGEANFKFDLGSEYRQPGRDTSAEAYDKIDENPFHSVHDDPLSTFSIDVDTASYSNVRRFLTSGSLPPADAVRVEELINYFSYDYPQPKAPDAFSVTTEVAECPWDGEHRLVHVGIQGRRLDDADVPRRNLVFLLDVSGSMESPDKLPLVKTGLRMLVDQLREDDRVAIVVYAGASGLVLPSTSGFQKPTLVDALDRLQAGGSTNGGEGIELAYKVARESFVQGGINRVILCSDGDFNVGVTSQAELVRLIERKRDEGVFLTVLGFGTGNLKDATMEQLADKGNGNYAYIDSEREARKVLLEEAGSTLVTIAKDVKIQVDFNVSQVDSYRLIGYENRILAHQDFNDDTKDAGEIGAGHTVTALYEVVPAGAVASAGVDPLEYQTDRKPTAAAASGRLMTVKVRYKLPEGDRSTLLTYPVKDGGARLASASGDFRFSAAVASFGMLLRDSEHRGQANLAQVLELARDSVGEDRGGYRIEFVQLVETARGLRELSAR